MADARTVVEVDLVGSARITDAVFPLVEPGSSAILFGSIAGYSDVDPAIEKLLCDPLADGLFQHARAGSGPTNRQCDGLRARQTRGDAADGTAGHAVGRQGRTRRYRSRRA